MVFAGYIAEDVEILGIMGNIKYPANTSLFFLGISVNLFYRATQVSEKRR